VASAVSGWAATGSASGSSRPESSIGTCTASCGDARRVPGATTSLRVELAVVGRR
jgi:hypothetical protein